MIGEYDEFVAVPDLPLRDVSLGAVAFINALNEVPPTAVLAFKQGEMVAEFIIHGWEEKRELMAIFHGICQVLIPLQPDAIVAAIDSFRSTKKMDSLEEITDLLSPSQDPEAEEAFILTRVEKDGSGETAAVPYHRNDQGRLFSLVEEVETASNEKGMGWMQLSMETVMDIARAEGETYQRAGRELVELLTGLGVEIVVDGRFIERVFDEDTLDRVAGRLADELIEEIEEEL